MGARLRLAVMGLAAAALAACADANTASSDGPLHRIGLTAGPLPQPKAFVIASRPAVLPPAPFIYSEAPAHTDTTLTADEQKQLEASLAADAETSPTIARRKKAPVTQKIAPLF